MNIKLISITPNASELIAYCARVSNPSNQQNTETAPKLIEYLIKHKHWSPFEMAHAVIEIETTRDIARQILRHRSFSFQEFSQRYAEVPALDGFREARMQDNKNRQNSLTCDDAYKKNWWNVTCQIAASDAERHYRQAIQMGIAKEVARAILPEGLTVSRLYMAGSIRSWMHYIDVRTGEDTQKEHREIAEECRLTLSKEIPGLIGMKE